ncbi:MAG TPA: fused MFS/spermidine synthase [Candidatus Saccharimonadales bacterium]|nr:fused MFS/spermidine synthase [Candidatus Saccharimonadales bacterium]
MKSINVIAKYRLETINLVVGAVVLTFELAASRIVAPYIGTTIYVWTSIIGMILAALAIGYALGGYIADKRHRMEDVIVMLLGASLLLIATNFIKDAVLAAIGGSQSDLRWQAFWASFILFAPPTIILGAISPYLVRLDIKDVAHSGRKVASISAAGTAGALLGTFLTGYVLFGFVGTSHILGYLAVALALTSFLVRSPNLLSVRILFLVAAVFWAAVPPGTDIEGLKAEIDTRYNRVIVRDSQWAGRPVRILQMDKQAWQSGVYKDGDELVFDYTRSFAAAARLSPADGKFLMIGGGAYTFPEYLGRTYADARIDVVELDAELLGISREYFDIRLPGNVHVFQADGREFINHNQERYDTVFVEVFSSLTPPFQLFTSQTADRLKESLRPGGMVVINIISALSGPDARFASAVENTYKEHFRNVGVYKVVPEAGDGARQNLTLIASDSGLPDGLHDGRSAFPRTSVKDRSDLVLRDDFAPVERLVH